MPIYEFRDTITNETFERIFSLSVREEFLKDNPQLVPVIGTPGIISMHGSAIGKTSDGWKDLLKSAKKGSGKGNTINI
jgi:hypothetical protein